VCYFQYVSWRFCFRNLDSPSDYRVAAPMHQWFESKLEDILEDILNETLGVEKFYHCSESDNLSSILSNGLELGHGTFGIDRTLAVFL